MHALEAEGSPVTDALCLFATPWWVNLAILVPLVSLCDWWRGGLEIAPRTLVIGAAFGVSFGFVEAAVVAYLRAVIGLYPAGGPAQHLALALLEIPGELLWIEVLREAATIVMLGSIALLAAQRARAFGHVPLRLCRLGPLLLTLGCARASDGRRRCLPTTCCFSSWCRGYRTCGIRRWRRRSSRHASRRASRAFFI